MKARVKATGEIIEVEPTFVNGNKVYSWVTDNGYFYSSGSLDFENLTKGLTYVKEKSFPKDEPDYWDKLHHQATIDFMKSFLDKYDGTVNIESLLSNAIKLAKSLVNKLKEDSQCEK